jgi:glycosyltransferase involved in cell wall biosynthesis
MTVNERSQILKNPSGALLNSRATAPPPGNSEAVAKTTTKLNVLLIGNFLSAQGIYGVCEGLAESLTNAGHYVVHSSSEPKPSRRIVDMLGTVWRERRRYDVAQVDVFSGRAFVQAELVCAALRRAKKPYVLTLHGGNLPLFAGRWPGRVRRLLRSAAAVTVPSTYLLEQMRPYHENLQLLPNPVDVNAYAFRLRKMVRPRLVWLRAFHELYHPSIAVRVLALLAPEFPEVHLTMIGPDKGDGSLARVRELARECGLSDRLTLAGSISKSEVPASLSEADIFLNTTSIDNVPISILEAMASGLCIVSTNVGGIPYLLRDEHDGLLVPPNDVASMTNAIRRILVEPGLAERLSANARKKAEQYDWSNILPVWESLLNRQS